MSLTHLNFEEFRYNQKGEYHNEPKSNPTHPFNKKPIKRFTPNNTICPSCGLTRSRANKCECNS